MLPAGKLPLPGTEGIVVLGAGPSVPGDSGPGTNRGCVSAGRPPLKPGTRVGGGAIRGVADGTKGVAGVVMIGALGAGTTGITAAGAG